MSSSEFAMPVAQQQQQQQHQYGASRGLPPSQTPPAAHHQQREQQRAAAAAQREAQREEMRHRAALKYADYHAYSVDDDSFADTDSNWNLILFATGLFIGYNWDATVRIAKQVGDKLYDIAAWPFRDSSKKPLDPAEFRVMNGVGVIVRRGEYILVGKRLNSHGQGTFAVPGGRLDPGENYFTAGIRELAEETGITLDIPLCRDAYVHPQAHPDHIAQTVARLDYISTVQETNKQQSFVIKNAFECPGPTLAVHVPEENTQLMVRYVVVDMPEGQEPTITEADKCQSWHWVKWTDIQALAQYEYKQSQVRLYQQLPTVYREKLQQLVSTTPGQENKSGNDNDNDNDNDNTSAIVEPSSSPPPAYGGTHTTSCQCPLCCVGIKGLEFNELGQVVEPTLPTLSEDCILRVGLDKLFAPMQALAITSFDPLTASYDDFQAPK